MTAHDRIRLTGLLRRAPASAGASLLRAGLTARGAGGRFARSPRTVGGRSDQATDEGAKDRKRRRRPGRCHGGRRRLLSWGASRPRGPRPDVLWRRQADDQLRWLRRRRGDRGGAPGQTARSSRLVTLAAAPEVASRWLATTTTGRSTRASPGVAGRRPTSGASPPGRTGWRSRPARSSRSAPPAPTTTPTSRSPATSQTARSTGASPATARRGPNFGLRQRGDRGGDPGQRQDRGGRGRR